MTDLFDQDNTDPIEIDPIAQDDRDYYSEYLERYKDEQSIGKALYHKDAFIEQLKSEQAGLRKDLEERIKMEEFLDKLNSTTERDRYSSDEHTTPPRETTSDRKALTAEDVKKLMEERDVTKKRVDNVNEVINTLKQKLGPDYQSKVKNTISQIGLDESRANQLASESPQAFYKMLGLDTQTRESFQAPPRSSINISGLSSSGRAPKYSDFDKLRREKPDEFWKPGVQNEIFRLTEQHGSKWLDT